MTSRPRTTTAATPPQLGDISFDDWYETPVFDLEPDERIEHLATSKLAPLRMLGSALVRIASFRSSAPAPRPVASAEPASLRGRAGRLLDRWAELETASQQRLEGRVLPKRWRE